MLKELGAKPDATLDPVAGIEWWRCKGDGKLPFTVPVEADGNSEFWGIQKICEAQGGRKKFDKPLI